MPKREGRSIFAVAASDNDINAIAAVALHMEERFIKNEYYGRQAMSVLFPKSPVCRYHTKYMSPLADNMHVCLM